MTINLVGPVTTTQVVTTAKNTLPVVRKTAETVVKTVKHLPKTGGAKKTLLAVVVAGLTALAASCTGEKNKINESQEHYQFIDEMVRLDNELCRAINNRDEAALDSIKKVQADLEVKHNEYLEPFGSQKKKLESEMLAYTDSIASLNLSNIELAMILESINGNTEKVDSLKQIYDELQVKKQKYEEAKNTLYEQLSSINDSIHARELSFEP